MRTLVHALASMGSMVTVVVCVALAVPVPALAQTDTGTEASSTAQPGTLPPSQKQPALSHEDRRDVLLASEPSTTAADENPDVMYFAGTCGASAAITLDDDASVIVGSDDDNFIRTYDLVEPADLVVLDDAGNVDSSRTKLHRPRTSQNFYKFLKVNQFSRRNFSAIEGAAVGDGFVFWSGSHERRRDGENRPNRRRFFATRIVYDDTTPMIEPYGKPVLDLAQQIEAADSLSPVGVSRSIMSLYRKLDHLAPQIRGFQIQALVMAPDGKTLLIALRNPLALKKAILIPLVNPAELAMRDRAIFGNPITLELDERGISAMTWVPELKSYLILAGEKAASDGYVLHRWSGQESDPAIALQEMPAGFDAQSFIVSVDTKRLLVLSDDSAAMRDVGAKDKCKFKLDGGRCPCVDLTDDGLKMFRALWVPIELKAQESVAALDPNASK